ncbi:hypothetical protein SAMN05519104_8194 [Rhizobiales bacterium GAS188]|nr:hypothetical protein SAMN05519104_8194 [Rhizobiales bacterium GAS188]
MTFDWCYVKRARDGKSIAVNPTLVRYVVEMDAKRSKIVFDGDHVVTIEGSHVEVADLLRQSLR